MAAAMKIRWGELEEEDGEDLDFLLPAKQVIGPDENGIKKVIEFRFNDDGNKVKITTTSRVRRIANARLSKRAVERRSWPKFGGAANEDASQSRRTVVSTEEIVLERPRAPGSKAEAANASDPFSSAALNQTNALMVCRTCGKKGDHWSARCPFKDLMAQPSDFGGDKPPTAPSDSSGAGGAAAAPKSSTYVPPGMRGGQSDRGGAGANSEMRRRNDENSVRVTNLSEDTREPDLLELFRSFGAVSRVYVAVDQKTGMSRGFGFVNFVNRDDAQRAINKLNGYGYDNLILRVEWATPRTN